MMRILLSVLLSSTMLVSQAQINVMPSILASMPTELDECSGLEKAGPQAYWGHNDSGGQNRIFKLDESGNILRTVWIEAASAIDYEDICRDGQGRIFVGDFGNNDNDRKDLLIYLLPDPAGLPTADTLLSGRINISYAEQALFPPPLAEQDFDCEAMLSLGDSLFLFTRNRGFTGNTFIYSLPADTGTFILSRRDTLYTGNPVTAAASSPSGQRTALLGYDFIRLFPDISGYNPVSGPQIHFILPLSQYEGISFDGEDRLILADEAIVGPNHLFALDISPYLSIIQQPIAPLIIQNPVRDRLEIASPCLIRKVEVFDSRGGRVLKVKCGSKDFSASLPPVRSARIVFCNVYTDEGIYHFKLLQIP